MYRSCVFLWVCVISAMVGCAHKSDIQTSVPEIYEGYCPFRSPISFEKSNPAALLGSVLIVEKDYRDVGMDQVLCSTGAAALAVAKEPGNLLDERVADIDFSGGTTFSGGVTAKLSEDFQAKFGREKVQVTKISIKNIHHIHFVQTALRKVIGSGECRKEIADGLKAGRCVRVIGNIYFGDITYELESTSSGSGGVDAAIKHITAGGGLKKDRSAKNRLVGNKMAFCVKLDRKVVDEIAKAEKLNVKNTNHNSTETKSEDIPIHGDALLRK